MRFQLLHALCVFGVSVVGLATAASAQIPACQAGLSFPTPALVRDPTLFSTAADLRLAVGIDRIVLTSNDSVQLRCRSTGGKLGSSTLPLRGGDLASGLFVTNPPVDDLVNDPNDPDDYYARNIFDLISTFAIVSDLIRARDSRRMG